ncbi:predicted protein [Nematostella vectensis]|uniref:Protein O-linked-mannose beta-1,4-N-acetylglucosaminyltransferase 2 n=1 Tax=Nematostella vectensis TaxID=45351 RepID=A7RQ04_NEMVE|nr:predicted protein [Nematostella vectensis]|eukprot:XP_001638473.1 predicted protein [Nematostella vectensis]
MAGVVTRPPVGNRDFASFALCTGAYLYASTKRMVNDMKQSAIFPVIFHVCVFLALQITYNVVVQQWNVDLSKLTVATTSCKSKKVSKLSSFESLRLGSSVWCSGTSKSDRICKFKNLCYHPVHKEYMFFHGLNSVIDGVPKDRFNPALLDLSSVDDHNVQYFNYVDFPAHSLDAYENVTIFDGNNYIFHRFHPDNIMHAIHDDLLPLFHTMKQYSNSGSSQIDLNSRLVFMEGYELGPYSELYQLFSRLQLVIKDNLTVNNTLKCFQNAVVGLSKFTTWYQYGFDQIQGPLPEIQITAKQIYEFTRFVRERLGINESVSHTQSPQVVLCTRHHNRLILNDQEISNAIITKMNKRVAKVSFETHSLERMIRIIGRSSGLIGMHGSILVMAMFLPQGSFLMELFPYGVVPWNYRPYKTLAGLPGMNLVYQDWINTNEENTVTHPDRLPAFGGIAHLSKDEQEDIINTKEVPLHYCCNDPYWLYRIYQDTKIDIDSFSASLNTAIEGSHKLFTQGFQAANELLLPGKVLNVSCVVPEGGHTVPALAISWKPPINVQYFENFTVQYEVWIQKEVARDYLAYILAPTEYVFTEGLVRHTKYRIWVRCLVNDLVGPFGVMGSCTTE